VKKIKFVFPQNYKMNTKLLGIIDYQSALINAIWGGLVFIIINIIFTNLNIKIFLFIVLTFPVIIFSIIGINGENIINVAIYMSKFLIKQKLLLYDK
jgi:hypothetical protein